MNKYEESFHPESIDEQIDKCSWDPQQHSTTLPNASLVHDLYRVYKEELEEDAILEKVRTGLAKYVENDSHSEVKTMAAIQDSKADMSRPLFKANTSPRRPFARFAALVASLVFVALLTGSMVTVFTLARHEATAPASGIYIEQAGGGIIYRVDAQTGKVVWSHPLVSVKQQNGDTLQSANNLIVTGNTVYAAISGPASGESKQTNNAQMVLALDAATGKTRWSFEMTSMEGSPDLTMTNGQLYASFTTAHSITIYAFKSTNGEKHIVYNLNKGPNAYITAEGNTLYMTASDGLRAINVTDGTQIWYAPKPDTDENMYLSRPHVCSPLLYPIIKQALCMPSMRAQARNSGVQNRHIT